MKLLRMAPVVSACCLLVLVLRPQIAMAAAGYMTIETEPSFFYGSFGTGKTLRVYEIPLTLRYHGAHWRVGIEVPASIMSGTNTLSGGALLQSGGQQGVRAGLGDIWLSAADRLNQAGAVTPSVEPYIKLKIATASRAQGLGTGRPDEEFGSLFEWRFGNVVFPYARIGYRITGRARGLYMRNAALFEVGASFALSPKRGQYLTGVFEEMGPLQSGTGPAETFTVAYDARITRDWSVQVFALRGFTANSPAYGGGSGVMVRF